MSARALLRICQVAALCIQLATPLFTSGPKIDCNDGGFYIRADPENCSNFYKCDHGNPVLFHCPSSLYFNPAIYVCDWPYNVKCVIRGDSQTSNNQNNHQSGYYDYNTANSGSKPYTGSESSHNNGQSQQYSDNNDYNNELNNGYNNGYANYDGEQTSDSDLMYPVRPVQIQQPDTAVGPSLSIPQTSDDQQDRPRPTVDHLVEANGNPYQDYHNPQNNIDIK